MTESGIKTNVSDIIKGLGFFFNDCLPPYILPLEVKNDTFDRGVGNSEVIIYLINHKFFILLCKMQQ